MRVTEAVERLIAATVGLPDVDLDRPYAWEEYDEDGLRFALLTAHHELRDVTARAAAARLAAGRPFSEGQRILAQFHEAYRDLTGALAGTSEGDLDAVPPDAQWPLREILGHLLQAESGFLAAIEVALEAARAGRAAVPDEVAFTAKRRAPLDPAGSRADALQALFRSHVAILRALDGVTDGELDTPSYFWERTGYPIRFRMHRFEEHLRQHTIQVDKTLIAIGHPPSEAERLSRNLHTALAGLESVAAGSPAGAEDLEDLERCAGSVDAITAAVRQVLSAPR